MRKILNLILIISITLCSALVLVGCGKEEPYTPNLTKTFTANGFEIKTTSDFVLSTTNEGLQLTSEGDDEISFNETYIYIQYDLGNEFYDFQTTTLDKYASDIAKIENKVLSSPSASITITEKLNDIFSGNLNMNMYIFDEMQNINGTWDNYTILCVGKGSNAFVLFTIYTSIQDDYYDENIQKLTAIVSSTTFMTPIEKTYDNSVKSNISTTMIRTGDFMSYFNFDFYIPNDYTAYEVPSYASGNHLAKSNYPENIWSSTIKCSNLASFMGNAILNDLGVKHLIKFSTNNLLGFYTKTITENSDLYKIYYLDSNNKLNIYYTIIEVSYSREMSDLGFGNYFEEQLISWMKDVIILGQ